ncbi:MAG: phosphoribosylanthranilate isomerase, partial [Cyclobacteriaceae bacterium]|nr:phosphoribosylanthranilate isomerase [Cyclobacteriaceae bacterium]
SVKRVGVFVDEPFEEVMMVSHRHNFDAVQLHGAETPEYCRRIRAEGKEVIKVFRIMDKLLQKDLDEYGEVVDYFLFDTFGKHYGGTGKTFDWNVLKGLRFDKPVFMSGGIDNVTVRQLVELPAKMYAVDVNSGYEEAPALKNIDELKKLKNFLRNEL